ncbi:helix-turn-helix domain-containing protein [Changpingibacter yushuensis]|uniref:helix-turn-helix domain-containing protein n=1 Tax=Changpingibacter yushuensis TaxID=2758440 RepID=UPI001C71209F|nr:helix-turn-helix domain-containing protein [Changpingibacter yushuensis]
MADSYLSLEETATHMGVSVKTVRRKISSGSLKAYRIKGTSRRLWIKESDIEKAYTRVKTIGS